MGLIGPTPAYAVYLQAPGGAVFGMLHPPAPGSRDVAILMLAPFGWDEVASYRSRRDWAVQLAGAGFPTLRLDLPGTGDSAGSPRDEDRLHIWSHAVSAAARWLRSSTGCGRLVAIGMGLGGLLACLAVEEAAPIDDLVLWATPSRGSRLLRELRAFASLEGSDFPVLSRPPRRLRAAGPAERSEDGDADLQVGGFVLTAETIAALGGVDLTRMGIPRAGERRILMLDRDGFPVDARLRAHLEMAGAAVDVLPGPGYGVMTAKPHEARPPLEVFERVADWLEPGSAGDDPGSPEDGPSPGVRRLSATTELEVAGTRIREVVVTVERPFGQLFGVLSEPVCGARAPVCAVLLNAGAIRRTGPNRLWVEAARRWALDGIATLRLDLAGLGDADGEQGSADLESLYDSARVPQVLAALDHLQARGLGPQFVLAGLCSGAYWAFHAALEDERVAAALMLNPRALFWDPSIEPMRELRMGLLVPSVWRRALRGDFSPARVAALLRWAPLAPATAARRAIARRRARRAGGDAVDAALDRLRETGKHVLMAFSGDEPLRDELAREGRLRQMDRWPNVALETLPGRTHTLRSLPSQRAAHAALDRALARELERAGRPERQPAARLGAGRV